MINSTEDNLEGVDEVIRRLDTIRNSQEVKKFVDIIKYDAENSGMNVRFKSRIKENQSAINKYKKYIEEHGKADPEMWDSCGMMVIVEEIDEVYEFVEFFKEKLNLRNNGLSDYIKNPKAGYRSIHMYSTFQADTIIVPAEIQIKTEAMSIAQDTVHDSIYKLKILSSESRDELSGVLFPIFEKSADADRWEKNGEYDKAKQLRREVSEICFQYEQLFSRNLEVVNNSWKEYGKVLFKHHNLDEIQGSLLIKNGKLTKEDKEKISKQLENALDKLFEYYCCNAEEKQECPIISGDKKIDYSIQRLKTMEHDEFIKELKMLVDREEKEENIEVASKEDFANIDSNVQPLARANMWRELLATINLLSKDSIIERA